jgi:hypothetical protein
MAGHRSNALMNSDNRFVSYATSRTALHWGRGYPAPMAGAASERVRLDDHGLSVARIARFNTSP